MQSQFICTMKLFNLYVPLKKWNYTVPWSISLDTGRTVNLSLCARYHKMKLKFCCSFGKYVNN